MPVTTASAAVHITPGAASSRKLLPRLFVDPDICLVVIKTFLAHSKRKGIKFKDGDKSEQAWDDLFYDECVPSPRPKPCGMSTILPERSI